MVFRSSSRGVEIRCSIGQLVVRTIDQYSLVLCIRPDPNDWRYSHLRHIPLLLVKAKCQKQVSQARLLLSGVSIVIERRACGAAHVQPVLMM